MPEPRGPGQRAGLTRAQVLGAARDLLVEGGLEALTMRALAGRLGVSPNALYSHVESKTALVDDILDEGLAAVEAPASEAGDPLAEVHAFTASTYRVLVAQSELIPLYLARQGARGPHARHLGDVMLAQLARGGVVGAAADEALHVLVVYTIGSAAFATRSPLGTGGFSPSDEGVHAERFERGLSWLLAGIGLSAHPLGSA